MPAEQATRILRCLNLSADEADLLKRRGLYVDMDRNGRIHEPSEITETELTGQLARARQAAESICWLLGAGAQARLANPPPEAIRLARALVSALTQARSARTTEDAVEVMLKAVSELRNAAGRARPPDGRPGRRPGP
jgi:hypothetical protein